MTFAKSGLIEALKLSFLSLLLMAAPRFAAAKMEFPPLLSTEEYANFIRKEIPEVFKSPSHAIDGAGKTYLVDIIQAEQKLVAQLKQNAEYMRLADQKPAPQVLMIHEVEIRQVTRVGVSPAWNEFLARIGLNASDTPEQTRSQLNPLLERWRDQSLSGFFSGWAGVLEKSDKSLLKEPNLARRWSEIKTRLSSRELSELREKFQASKFGLQEQNWTWSDLDKAFEDLLSLENRIATLVQQLNPKGTARGEAWFMTDELQDWSDLLEADGPLKKRLESLKDRLTLEFSDPNAVVSEEVPKRTLILREVPPYLAVYRGCVGSDCSTTSSFAFPYAPSERDWWIEDAEGKRLGYVSGAITQVGGRDCLYIRDVTGPGLEPANIPLILYGFYKAMPFYGVDQMSIMPTSFTSQNHFANQVAVLNAFGKGFSKEVRQTFSDQAMRDRYLGNLQYSGSAYDETSRHTDVRLITPPNDILANIRATSTSGSGEKVEVERIKPQENSDKFFSVLLQALNMNDPRVLESQVETKADWPALLAAIRNEGRQGVQEFQRTVQVEFEKAQIPFSRNIQKKNEALFLQGFLAAPDAFGGENIRQAARYVTDILWRNKGSNQMALDLIHNNLTVMEENDVLARNVKGLFERRQPEDLDRLRILWEAGYRFLHVDLSVEDLKWLAISSARPEILSWALEKIGGANAHTEAPTLGAPVAEAVARMLENSDESIDENISIGAALLFDKWPGLMNQSDVAVHEVEQSLQSEDNPEIGFPLARAYLRDRGRQASATVAQAAQKWLEGHCERALDGPRRSRN